MNLLASMAAIALAWSISGHAQTTLTGKWQGETRNGSSILLELAVKDTTLTGTFTRGDVSTPIVEGKVSKNTFTFKAKVNEQTESLSGELADGQIKIWLDRQGPATAIVLTPAKAPNG